MLFFAYGYASRGVTNQCSLFKVTTRHEKIWGIWMIFCFLLLPVRPAASFQWGVLRNNQASISSICIILEYYFYTYLSDFNGRDIK